MDGTIETKRLLLSVKECMSGRNSRRLEQLEHDKYCILRAPDRMWNHWDPALNRAGLMTLKGDSSDPEMNRNSFSSPPDLHHVCQGEGQGQSQSEGSGKGGWLGRDWGVRPENGESTIKNRDSTGFKHQRFNGRGFTIKSKDSPKTDSHCSTKPF